jgi:hypothetical protein
MSHFARVNAKGLVDKVIVAEQDFIDTLSDSASWVQTSYNTRGGLHYDQNNQPDDGVALRKNFAGVGYKYDPIRDAFIPPQPHNSWTLNETTCLWEPPFPAPVDGIEYDWDELTHSWIPMFSE